MAGMFQSLLINPDLVIGVVLAAIGPPLLFLKFRRTRVLLRYILIAECGAGSSMCAGLSHLEAMSGVRSLLEGLSSVLLMALLIGLLTAPSRVR